MVLLPTEHYYRIAVDSLEESLTNGIDVDPALIKDIRSGPYVSRNRGKMIALIAVEISQEQGSTECEGRGHRS